MYHGPGEHDDAETGCPDAYVNIRVSPINLSVFRGVQNVSVENQAARIEKPLRYRKVGCSARTASIL
jgi:hypothetical protein